MRKASKNRKGFSIVEMLVAITVGSVVIILFGEMIVQGYKTYAITTAQITAVATARRVQDRIVRELREATLSEAGAYALITADPRRLEFYGDVDADDESERIRYWTDGTALMRGITKAVSSPPTYPQNDDAVRTIAKSIAESGSIFRYFDRSGVERTPPVDVTDIVTVSIQFTVDVSPGTLPQALTTASRVYLRNVNAAL